MPNLHSTVCKVDEALGIVFGWAIVSKIDGREYFDLQGDHIPEETMLKAAAGFMQGNRVAGEMHTRRMASSTGADVHGIGRIIFAFPLTTEIAKKMGLSSRQTGLMIGMKPDSDEVLRKFRSGEYRGFSIGGYRLKDREID